MHPCPAHIHPFYPLPHPFFVFSDDEAGDDGQQNMSTSSLVSCPSWPMYGVAPMTNYPDCPLVVTLKRLVTMVDKNVNLGREFVKQLSKPDPEKV
jgi:hypothetical protein